MNAVLDDLLVAVLLLASLAYAAYKLGPRRWRTAALLASSRWLLGAPPALHLQGLAQRLAAAGGKPQGACGGCDSCDSETAAAPQSGTTEIKIPAAKIGRRT